MTYRVAADVLEQMLPVDAGANHETLRSHTLKMGEHLQDRAVIKPTIAATAIVISVDSTFMHAFQGKPNRQRSEAPSRKLWAALAKLNGYLCGESNWLVNYAERLRAGLRVGTALTEATANFLVNRRRTNRSKCDGHDAARTFCCRSAALSTTALSALSLANGLRRTLVYPHKSQWPPDPQVLDSLGKTVASIKEVTRLFHR